MNIAGFFKKFWIAIVLVFVAAVGIIVWQNNAKAASSSTYKTTPATRGTLTANVGATGTVRAGQSANLTWQTNGRVETVTGKIGTAVKADDVLASLMQTSMSQAIILAEADLINAKKNLVDLMASNTSLAQAEQSLAVAKQGVSYRHDKGA